VAGIRPAENDLAGFGAEDLLRGIKTEAVVGALRKKLSHEANV